MSLYDLPPVHTMRPDLKISNTIGDSGGLSTSPGKIVFWYVECSQYYKALPSQYIDWVSIRHGQQYFV